MLHRKRWTWVLAALLGGVGSASARGPRWKSLETKAMRQLSRMEVDNAARSILAAVDSVKTPGEEHLGMASTLSAIGTLLAQSGKAVEGCRLLERAVALEQGIDGEGALGAGATLITLAAMELKAERPARAEAAASRSLKIIETMGKDSPELVEPLALLVQAWKAQGKDDSSHAVLARKYPALWPRVQAALAPKRVTAPRKKGISVAAAERQYKAFIESTKVVPAFARWAKNKRRGVGKMSRGELLRLQDELAEREKPVNAVVAASDALGLTGIEGSRKDVEALHKRWGKPLTKALRGVVPAMNESMALADAIDDALMARRR